jgi:hypothetical protein
LRPALLSGIASACGACAGRREAPIRCRPRNDEIWFFRHCEAGEARRSNLNQVRTAVASLLAV